MATSPFGTRLKELREAAGLSQSELAERAGMRKGSIADCEQGRFQPRLGNGTRPGRGPRRDAGRIPAGRKASSQAAEEMTTRTSVRAPLRPRAAELIGKPGRVRSTERSESPLSKE